MAVTIDGVDISHWQNGKIDYAAGKKAGVKFIYHKATEGSSYRDPNYEFRRREAEAAGIPFGAYHFAHPKVNNAVAEAKWFLKTAAPKPGDMIPMLDLETNEAYLTSAQLTTWVGQFVNELHKAGFKTIIYTPFDLRADYGCPLWVARYNDAMQPPRVPTPWKQWDIWQFSDGRDGKPDSVPGFGNVDINVMREGLDLNTLRVQKPAKPHKRAARITIQHSSMEVFDTKAEQRADAVKVMGTGSDVICGTEAGPDNRALRRALRRQAWKNGYYIHFGGKSDSWIAIKQDICVEGVKPKWGYDHIFDSAKAVGDPNGPYGARGIAYGVFAHKTIGVVSVGTSHFLTKGRTRSQTPRGEFNHYDMNTKLAKDIGAWARRFGKSTALAFFTADANIPDNKDDVFRGEPLTTSWDELKKWPDTGHGTIDIIASYDKDGRVRCVSGTVLTYLELNSDHKTVVAIYEVSPLI